MSFLGTQELLVILVVALLVVGPKRLPDLAKNIGKGIRNFKNATAKMRSELDESGAMDEINELKASVQGLRDDINLQMPELKADATTSPKLAETAPPASAASLDATDNQDFLLEQAEPADAPPAQLAQPQPGGSDSDDPLVRILNGR